MPGIVEVISAIDQIRKAVSLVTISSGRKEFQYPNDHFKRIGSALSGIYFPETGILGVLKRLQKSTSISEDDRKRLAEFNQREEPVQNTVENLVSDYGKNSRNSIQQSRIIGDIRGRKITLRSAVQMAINEALTFDQVVDQSEVSRLIEEIEQLNTDIAKAEHELRQFM